MINIAILGFGKIGGGTADMLSENKDIIEKRLGEKVNIKYILDKRDLGDSPYSDKVTTDIEKIISDPEVSIIAEMMGGSHPAYEFSMKALSAGKNVVTSNKEVVSKYGTELLRAAHAHGVRYLFEASVGGGIPIIRPMTNDLCGNEIYEINGILNGTTNYILTQMFDCGKSFDEALAEAKDKGYAELDPSDDILGVDACRKICILAAIAFGRAIDPDTVSTEGITKITEDDVKNAAAYNCSIKLLGRAKKSENSGIHIMVAPFFINNSSPLSHISDVFNGIMVTGNAIGEVLFYGRGAGKSPTASAVISDIIDIALHSGQTQRQLVWEPAPDGFVSDLSSYKTRAYLSFAGSVNTDTLRSVFGEDIHVIKSDTEYAAMVTPEMTNKELDGKILSATARGLQLISRINVLY